ncbi:MAG: hypothetical protein KatS3mg105_3336 [Gemmatales bacterium]|nr:MAG: hypothetical protein KatS3mg105_3336 [Gemmatales bacterium]
MIMRCGILACPALLLVVPLLRAEVGPEVTEALKLSSTIDRLIEVRIKDAGIRPAPLASDAEFMRRVYLDLAGRIPRVSEVRAFLDDKRPDKRARLVEQILRSAAYVNHMTNTWNRLLLPESNNRRFLDQTFRAWLAQRFRDNVAYDTMVRELITAPVGYSQGRSLSRSTGAGQAIAFYQANEFKPENLAASVSRIFLGVKLECAQCHNHPFAEYKRTQFWQLAAFFAGIRSTSRNGFVTTASESPRVNKIKIPDTETEVVARFLDGTEPDMTSDLPLRQILADWVTSPTNPYFAKATVNRFWAHFFGIGFVDPVDEPSEGNPPSHPELLEEMGRQFAAHQFDLKYLIRAIVNSKTYQRTSEVDGEEPEPRLFACMAIKGLTAEQFWDSLVQATGYRQTNPQAGRQTVFTQTTARQQFLAMFASQERPTEYQSSILQALMLMNGDFIGSATDGANLEKTERLAAIWDAPFLDTTAKKVEVLFLATLSRMPSAEELDRMVRYVDSGGPKKNPRAAIADVFWALLNSSEFMFNH